jgi:asparagine synthase (glutamine-hydrolysing)
MSAIWGCIDLSGKELLETIPDNMSRCIDKYKIDAVNYVLDGNVYLACGLQYLTKESRQEVLPFRDGDIYYTADCVLDDRQSLVDEINKYQPGCGASLDTPDGMLLYLAFKIWGESFGDHVLGLFSFAVYDKTRNEFYLYTDHISSRCIHYYVDDNKVYFGTLTSCITDAVPDIKICDKWMAACEAMDNPSMLLFPGLTPFENVYILTYGTGIKVSWGQNAIAVEKLRYYNPYEISMDKRISDEECRKLFVTTFEKCVYDALRTDGNVGILLSSGLDSTSVGGVAATFLKKDNRVLHSYTSVPLKEYNEKNDNKAGYWVDDESDEVKLFCEYYDNIKTNFLECEGKSTLAYVEETVDYLEFPVKALINHVWLSEAYDKARNDDACKVILSGAFGNWTISYGDVFQTAYRALCEGKIFTCVSQLSRYGKILWISRKKIFKAFWSALLKTRKVADIEGMFDEEVFRKELLSLHGVEDAWRERLTSVGGALRSEKQFRDNLLSPLVLQLMGLYATKDGLYNGIIIRDPTKDKRMIELCLRIPYKWYGWDGLDRRLVREYLKDYVPNKIRLIGSHRGRQSGDAAMRYDKYGLPNGANTWDILNENVYRYFHEDKAIGLLKEETTDDNVSRKVKILSCSYFLDKYYK